MAEKISKLWQSSWLKPCCKAVLFILILFLLLYFFNYLYIKNIYEKGQSYQKEEMYSEYLKTLSPKQIDYAFFGDSHSAEGINPDYIPNSYNFAFPARNYVKTYYDLRKLLYRDNLNINTAVFQIDLESLSSSLAQPNHISDTRMFLQFMSYNEISKITGESVLFLWLKANFPVIGNGMDFFKPKEPFEGISLGWLKVVSDFSLVSDQVKFERAMGTYRFYFEGQQIIDSLSFEYFLKTLKLANDNNINIILIKTPVEKTYEEIIAAQNISKEDYYNRVFNGAESVLPEGVHVLDYYSLFFNNSEYFGDADHPNYRGAEALSKKIYNDIKNLNLSKKDKPSQLALIRISSGYESQAQLRNFLFLSLPTLVAISVLLLILRHSRKNPKR